MHFHTGAAGAEKHPIVSNTFTGRAERSPLFSAGYEVTADSGTPPRSPQKATNSADWFAIRLQRGKMESFLYPLYRAGGDHELTNSLVM